MLRHLEETEGVSEGSRVDDDRAVLFTLQRVVDREQRCHLGHAGQGGVEQRFDLFAAEDGPALDDGKDRLAVLVEELAEFALRVHLPNPQPLLAGE